jgi:hypothetical protein
MHKYRRFGYSMVWYRAVVVLHHLAAFLGHFPRVKNPFVSAP